MQSARGRFQLLVVQTINCAVSFSGISTARVLIVPYILQKEASTQFLLLICGLSMHSQGMSIYSLGSLDESAKNIIYIDG